MSTYDTPKELEGVCIIRHKFRFSTIHEPTEPCYAISANGVLYEWLAGTPQDCTITQLKKYTATRTTKGVELIDIWSTDVYDALAAINQTSPKGIAAVIKPCRQKHARCGQWWIQ
jgi:hypothetical protein